MQHDFILLDRSGSMVNLWTEALGSINSYVEKLAEDKVDTGVTLVAFDERIGQLDFQIVRDRITPPTWHAVKDTEVSPRGGTPLSDAVGKIVALAKAGDYDKVAIIIMTDGQENASKELTVTQAKLLLDQCRARGWQVIFLGANFDNARQAQSYGTVDPGHSHTMAVGTLRATMTMAAEKRGFYGSGAASTMSFTEDEKTALNNKKTTP